MLGPRSEVGIAGATAARRMDTLCQVRMLHATLDLFGIMNVLRIPALRSTGSLGHPGFLMAVATIHGMDLIATGVMGVAHNRMGMDNRTTTLSRMDMGNKMDIVNNITVNKMGTTSRMDIVNKMDV